MDASELIPSFGYWVRRRRLSLDLTQAALAARVGCAIVTLRKIEADERRPSRQMAERLAKCLEVPPQERGAFLQAARGERAVDRLPPIAGPAVQMPPGNLPAPVASLVGRRVELDAILRNLRRDDVRLLTLIGPAGVGKTRLALAAAREAVSFFPDGIWFVALAPVAESALTSAAVAGALGVRERPGQSLELAVSDHLASRRLLLLLDNCEHLPEAFPFFARLLPAAPGLKVLATSRTPLRLYGEHLVPVEPLPLPGAETDLLANDAVRLFVERATAAHFGFTLRLGEADSVAEICRKLDGLPLALELAAAYIRRHPMRDLLAALDRPLAVLQGGPRDVPPRHRSLRDALTWSYDLLPRDVQRTFERLSVFRGGFTEETVRVVSGVRTEEETAAALERLVDDSLVVRREGRYTLLETVRQYAAERLAERGETAGARRCHLAHFRRLAEQAARELWGPAQAQWMARLIAEEDNLRAALGWAFGESASDPAPDAPDDADREDGVLLAAAMWLLCNLRGQLSEGRRWLMCALAFSIPGTRGRALSLVALGSLVWQQGEYDEADRCLAEGLTASRLTGDPAGVAEAAHLLGHLTFDRQDFARAGELFAESQALYREIRDEVRGLPLGGDLGLVACHLGDYAAARQHYEAWRADAERLGVRDSVASSLVRLGDLDRAEEDYALAGERYERASAIYHELKEEVEEAGVLCKLGRVARRQGDLERAASLLRRSLMMQRRFENRQGVVEALAGLAGLALDQEEPVRAAKLLGAAAALLSALGAPISPPDRLEWEQDEARLRAGLGPELWTNLQAAGAALDEAEADALRA